MIAFLEIGPAGPVMGITAVLASIVLVAFSDRAARLLDRLCAPSPMASVKAMSHERLARHCAIPYDQDRESA